MAEDFESLKKILISDRWPNAAPPILVCDITSEEDKTERAEAILDLWINQNLDQKKILDIGCGEGHLVQEASKSAKLAVGYEPKIFKHWKGKKGLFTKDKSDVQKNGPYDIISIYDVLDHCDNPNELLQMAKDNIKDDGRIYLRLHPWVSRHGGHYFNVNKAFVHLIFSEKEMAKMGYTAQSIDAQKVYYPIGQYKKNWIEQSGLKIVEERIESQPPEPFFFNNEIILNRLKANTPFNFSKHLQGKFQMGQTYHDYILSK